MLEHVAEETEVDVTVVIPAFNAAATIGDQLDALLSQHWTGSWEVVVSDNGSSDATRSIVEAVSRRDPRVRVVDASGYRGPSFARNTGVEHARGAVIAFCDADDVVGVGWVAAMGEALRDADLVAGPLEQDALNPPMVRNVHGSAVSTEMQVFAGAVPFGASANLGVRRELFRRVGGFDPALRIGEDIDLCLRLRQLGVELQFVVDAVVHYRNRQTVSALFRQSVSYGAASVGLFVRLAELGILDRPKWSGARNWLWLVRSAPMLWSGEGRARWVAVAGSAAGRLVGSVRYRSLYV